MKNSKKKGILEKKGMHGVIRPWARREIEYDPSARVLRYSSGGKLKGTVMLKPKESQIKIINPKDANGKAFAFEVSCFKLSETGAAERTQQRLLLCAISDVERQSWMNILQESLDETQKNEQPMFATSSQPAIREKRTEPIEQKVLKVQCMDEVDDTLKTLAVSPLEPKRSAADTSSAVQPLDLIDTASQILILGPLCRGFKDSIHSLSKFIIFKDAAKMMKSRLIVVIVNLFDPSVGGLVRNARLSLDSEDENGEDSYSLRSSSEATTALVEQMRAVLLEATAYFGLFSTNYIDLLLAQKEDTLEKFSFLDDSLMEITNLILASMGQRSAKARVDKYRSDAQTDRLINFIQSVGGANGLKDLSGPQAETVYRGLYNELSDECSVDDVVGQVAARKAKANMCTQRMFEMTEEGPHVIIGQPALCQLWARVVGSAENVGLQVLLNALVPELKAAGMREKAAVDLVGQLASALAMYSSPLKKNDSARTGKISTLELRSAFRIAPSAGMTPGLGLGDLVTNFLSAITSDDGRAQRPLLLPPLYSLSDGTGHGFLMRGPPLVTRQEKAAGGGGGPGGAGPSGGAASGAGAGDLFFGEDTQATLDRVLGASSGVHCLIGPAGVGKSEQLLGKCHEVGKKKTVVWVDVLGSKTDGRSAEEVDLGPRSTVNNRSSAQLVIAMADNRKILEPDGNSLSAVLSAVASQLGVVSKAVAEMASDIQFFLELLPSGSVVVVDGVEETYGCAQLVQLMKGLADRLCIVLSLVEGSAPALLGLEEGGYDVEALLPLSAEPATTLVTAMYRQRGVAMNLAAATAISQLANMLPEDIKTLCYFPCSCLASTLFSSKDEEANRMTVFSGQTVSLLQEKLSRRVSASSDDKLFATCMSPLWAHLPPSAPHSAPFNECLSWFLCKAAFADDVRRWQQAWNSLVGVGWLVKCADRGVFIRSESQFISSQIFCDVDGAVVRKQWALYYSYWSTEATCLNAALDQPQLKVSTLLSFDCQRHHFNALFHLFARVVDVRYFRGESEWAWLSDRAEPRTLLDIAQELNGNIEKICEHRLTPVETVRLSRGIMGLKRAAVASWRSKVWEMTPSEAAELKMEVWKAAPQLAALYAIAGKHGDGVADLNSLIAEVAPERSSKNRELDIIYADMLFMLGVLRRSLKNMEDALESFQECLNVRVLALGKEHESTMACTQAVAMLLAKMGRHDQAKPLLQQAIKMKGGVESGGEVTLDLVDLLHSLADAYVASGQYDAAEDTYKRVLTMRRQLLGGSDDDEAVTAVLTSLGHLLYDQDKFDDALVQFLHALKITQSIFGDSHISATQEMNSIANIYVLQDKYDDAKGYYEQVLNIMIDEWGEEHPDVASAFANCARVSMAQEKYEDARKQMERVVEIRREAYGDTHPKTQAALADLEEATRLAQSHTKPNRRGSGFMGMMFSRGNGNGNAK